MRVEEVNIDEILRLWARDVQQAPRGLCDREADWTLADLLMHRNTIGPTTKRFFELFSEKDLVLSFVKEFDEWTKLSFAREVSKPWRQLLEDLISTFPQEVRELWSYLDSQIPTLTERVEEVRSVLKLSGLQPHEQEFRARLLDLGVKEEVFVILQKTWPSMPHNPSLAHREIFSCP